MTIKQALYLGTAATVLAAFATGGPTQGGAQAAGVTIDGDGIGGGGTGPRGPGAGGGGGAENNDLSTKIAKIRVTECKRRYGDSGSSQSELHPLGARLRAR